jgi:pyruvate dehydrogenase E2 component (dihydrolipoamide acetyltransferase)
VPSGAIQYPLDAAGVTTRVVQWGASGAPVVFPHGLGSHAEVWSAVAPTLAAQGRRCVALDLPGHGLSGKGAGFSYDLEGHAAWLEAAADALGESEFHLVASSLGGLWAAGFAVRFPRRIASLTLVGAVGLERLTPERLQWTSDYLGRMDRSSIADRLRRAVADPGVIDASFIEETYRMNNSAGAAEAFARLGRYYLDQLNHDVQLERLAKSALGSRLLLLWGKDDATVAYSGAVAAARRLPECTLFALERTRHVPHLERPSAVSWALSRHLRLEPLPPGCIEGGEISRGGGLKGDA